MKVVFLIAALAAGLVAVAHWGRRTDRRLRGGRDVPEPRPGTPVEAWTDDPAARAKADIEEFGWHIVGVEGEGAAGFVYTIGLWESYGHPEILLFAPSEDPSAMLQQLAAVARRVGGGETFATGSVTEGVFGANPGAVQDVLPIWIPSFMGIARAVYESRDFPAVQLYWPDEAGLFPWQSGFNTRLFTFQPILNESNVVLANVGFEVAREAPRDKNPRGLAAALEELFLGPESLGEGDLLEDWRWLLGPEPELFRVTLFGDVFLKTADGRIDWLDTGASTYEEVTTDQEAWRRMLCEAPEAFFHASTLLHFRSLEFVPDPGQVYSWIQLPSLGGQETVDNFDVVSAAVHLSHSGRTARAAQGAEHPSGTHDDDAIYRVVTNSEQQYSMWPVDDAIPAGWSDAGQTGTHRECLEFIDNVWVDLRPESLRRKLEPDEMVNRR